jgi:hypothetical protein
MLRCCDVLSAAMSPPRHRTHTPRCDDRGRGDRSSDSKHPHRRQHQHQHEMLHLHTATRRVGRRSHAAQDILVRTSSSAACLELSPVRNHHRRLSWAAHTATSLVSSQPAWSPDRLCPSVHSLALLSRTPIPSLPHRRCDASLCLAAARGASHCPAPNHGPTQVPLLKRTAGLHTPCYSCPTHTHPLALAAPHVATLGSRALQIQSPSRQTCLLRLRNTAPTTTPSVPLLANSLVTIIRFRFARLHLHQRLLALHFASLYLATPTASRAPLTDLVTAT